MTDPQLHADNHAATPDDAAAPLTADIPAMGYERARQELVQVVQELESGRSGLEESLHLWERGEALAQHCERWLAGARERLDATRRQYDDADTGADHD
ncbi:MAG: exodeoxyribonuclease VII small subunit [Bowdeniella nasicola]|nr:exodeoxyribonuclease VII small subunit [Bowdeniella nasicola]